VAITGRGTGRTVHAEAWGADFRAALDCAVEKLEEQLRRRRDRLRLRHVRWPTPGRLARLSAARNQQG
jgi:ribosome-associated translation inhibitor RaiA